MLSTRSQGFELNDATLVIRTDRQDAVVDDGDDRRSTGPPDPPACTMHAHGKLAVRTSSSALFTSSMRCLP
eukprot:924199-Prymnesium_polylepis.1